jgi:signal transduction histidine kinase
VREVTDQLLNHLSVVPTYRLDQVEESSDVIEGVLRVLREAIVNAVTHGPARSIEVVLRDGNPLVLTVTDDGDGFEVEEGAGSGRGFGIATMRERAAALDGEVHIHSHPGRGTTVELWLPR